MRKVIRSFCLMVAIFYSLFFCGCMPGAKKNCNALIFNDKYPNTINRIDSITIAIEEAFDKNRLFIEVDNIKLYDKTITTNHLIGLADVTTILRPSNILRIAVDNSEILIRDSFDYNYLLISYSVDECITATFTNKKPLYK